MGKRVVWKHFPFLVFSFFTQRTEALLDSLGMHKACTVVAFSELLHHSLLFSADPFFFFLNQLSLRHLFFFFFLQFFWEFSWALRRSTKCGHCADAKNVRAGSDRLDDTKSKKCIYSESLAAAPELLASGNVF